MELALIPWREAGEPAEQDLRDRLEREGFEVVAWRDRCDWSYDAHSHRYDESLWVLRGSLVLSIGGADYRLGPGDRLMLPKQTRHTAHAGPDGAVYLIGQRRQD